MYAYGHADDFDIIPKEVFHELLRLSTIPPLVVPLVMEPVLLKAWKMCRCIRCNEGRSNRNRMQEQVPQARCRRDRRPRWCTILANPSVQIPVYLRDLSGNSRSALMSKFDQDSVWGYVTYVCDLTGKYRVGCHK